MKDYNVPLNEDGSLDIERINRLPLLEYTKIIGRLTGAQRKQYYSNLPILEGKHHTKAVKFYSFNHVIENRMGVDIDEYLDRKLQALADRL